MKKINSLVCGLLLLLAAQNGFGQTPNSGQRTTMEHEREIQELRAKQQRADMIFGNKDKNGMMNQSGAAKPSNHPKLPPPSPEQIEQMAERRREFEIAKRRLLAPAEYYQKYETFLSDKNTGLARLFVYKNCDQGKMISVQELERCGDVIPIRGEGAYYTFRLRQNYFFSPYDWDIGYMNDKFIVGNELVQGMIADVGDVDLNDVNLKSPALAFLKEYDPKTAKTEIKEQSELLSKGIDSNNFNYSNFAAVRPGSTYVLRSIAYLLEGEKPITSETLEMLRGINHSGRGMDVMVAFKIVGLEEDGSLILLWKELRMEKPRRKLK